MEPTKDSFPKGLRVLVVDDDPICLLILEKLLRRCAYEVTTCEKATVALAMLREKKCRFDLVISDVYMPDMDGFKLLELVGLEMDLPVIMMSADGETSAVMKGITHGACDYLLKPVRIEELRNIWQHVLRKRRCEAKDSELSVSVEVVEDTEHTCPSNSKKRKDMKEDEDEDDDENDHEADDSTALKKPRVVWSVELHQQFVSAVNQLGIDKAVPKRILELMGVQGLTRENVASHLQKYRLFLKRLSIAPYKSAIDLPFAGGQESSTIRHMGSLDRLNDLHSLATSGQLSTQALAPVHSAMLSRLGNINGVGPGPLDNSLWLQLAALQGSNYGYLSRPMLQTPWLNSQGNILQAISGEVELDQLAQTRQSLGQQGPSGDNLAETNVLQHRISLKGEAGMKTTESIVDSGFDSSSGTALMAHLLQQPQQKQHAQIRTAAGANLPLGACSGQSILSVETNNHVGWLPKAGSITSSFNSQGGSLGVDSSSMVSNGCLGGRDPASHGLGSHRLISSVGSKSQTSLHVVDDFQIVNGADANFQKAAPTAIAASAVMETGTNLVYVNDNYNNTQVNRVSMQNFSAVGNLSSSIRPTSRQPKITGWQGQNSSVNQNLGQVPHFLEIPFYGQLLNENENTSTVSGPSEKDFLELTGADFNLPKDAEVSYFGPSTGACAKRDHATTESFHISKEQWSVDSADTKLESSASIFGDSSSDDLLTLILKQQEGMMGFTENDSALDGFAAEICM